jgi:hypothetical protein
MAINSSKASIVNSSLFTRSEMQILFPSNSSPALFNYVANGIATGLTKNQILSSARYLTYVQNQGFTIETISGTTYAKREFLSSGNFDPGVFSGSSARVLVVGGGGSGGAAHAGGGGAGGIVVHDSFVTTGTSVVTVGAGGAARPASDNTVGFNGANSSIYTLTGVGGGGGGTHHNPGPGVAGGSGGGGGIGPSSETNQSGGASIQTSFAGATVYGHAGGVGRYTAGNSYPGAGGGGAGGRGLNHNESRQGGPGILYLGSYYGGGGGGGAASGGAGGIGGGGAGGSASIGTAGQDGTGGGSGGAGGGTFGSRAGGSGIVIVRYVLTVPSVFGA